jgi:PAS domain S-box-containing protein
LLAVLVTELVDYAIFVLDVEGNVSSWNAGAARLTGYRTSEIVGRHFSVLYPLADVECGKPQRDLAMAASDGRLENEGWRVRKDGTLFLANIVTTTLRDSAGVLHGYGEVTRDLTEHRMDEHATSPALASVGTWELDVVSGVMQWSREYEVLYGVDPAQFVASRRAFQEIIHRDDREILSEAVKRIVHDGTVVEVRYRIIRPNDGAERWLRSHLYCERDLDGAPVRVVGTGQDVTDLEMVLSPRESEMLMLLAEGMSGEAIAEHLVLSPATVRTHIHNAMVRLGAHTRGQAIATALRLEEIGS